MKYRILVVDDEEDICEILQFNLHGEGFETDVAYSAEEVLQKPVEKYDLILLDVMMGKMSGFRLAEKLRKEYNLKVPIIFLTAKDTENDTLTGFSVGADDYILKPFSIKEVIARINAVLSRSSESDNDDELIKFEGLELNGKNKSISIDGTAVGITKKEFGILQLLLINLGRTFSRDEILERIWSDDVIVTSRTVDVNITRLRKKLGKYGKYINSRSGYGYCFETNL